MQISVYKYTHTLQEGSERLEAGGHTFKETTLCIECACVLVQTKMKNSRATLLGWHKKFSLCIRLVACVWCVFINEMCAGSLEN